MKNFPFDPNGPSSRQIEQLENAFEHISREMAKLDTRLKQYERRKSRDPLGTLPRTNSRTSSLSGSSTSFETTQPQNNYVTNHDFENDDRSRRGKVMSEPYMEDEVNIPTFDGTLDPEDFLIWLIALERNFKTRGYSDTKAYKVACHRLTNRASRWLEKVNHHRASEGETKVQTWDELRRLMLKKFVPEDYRQDLHDDMISLRQGNLSVGGYTKKFEQLRICCEFRRTSEQTIERYLDGLHSAIAEEVESGTYFTLEDVKNLALKAEKRRKEKRGSPKNILNPTPPPNLTSSLPRCPECLGFGHHRTDCPNGRTYTLEEFIDFESIPIEEPSQVIRDEESLEESPQEESPSQIVLDLGSALQSLSDLSLITPISISSDEPLPSYDPIPLMPMVDPLSNSEEFVTHIDKTEPLAMVTNSSYRLPLSVPTLHFPISHMSLLDVTSSNPPLQLRSSDTLCWSTKISVDTSLISLRPFSSPRELTDAPFTRRHQKFSHSSLMTTDVLPSSIVTVSVCQSKGSIIDLFLSFKQSLTQFHPKVPPLPLLGGYDCIPELSLDSPTDQRMILSFPLDQRKPFLDQIPLKSRIKFDLELPGPVHLLTDLSKPFEYDLPRTPHPIKLKEEIGWKTVYKEIIRETTLPLSLTLSPFLRPIKSLLLSVGKFIIVVYYYSDRACGLLTTPSKQLPRGVFLLFRCVQVSYNDLQFERHQRSPTKSRYHQGIGFEPGRRRYSPHYLHKDLVLRFIDTIRFEDKSFLRGRV